MLQNSSPVSRLLGLSSLLLLLMGLSTPTLAQTPVTKVKDSNGNVLLKVIEDGGLVAYEAGFSGIPATGAGKRMMWYPAKAAFRAGVVGGQTGKEDVWDASNVGGASAAFGTDTKASGANSTALGKRTSATGAEALAIGVETIASGGNAVAIGENTTSTANDGYEYSSKSTWCCCNGR